MAHKFEHLKIQLEAIKSATNNFADESCIGKGGFGRVYKGKIGGSDGHTMVALKRLDPRFGQGVAEFWKEVMLLSQYKHNNIVSLLGFCDEGGEKILVYEYVPNKSLDRYISSDNLRWIQRLKICIDAAHGLAYLHNAYGTQQRVLHRDIKSANILLDENWNAKISDFGLSKLGPANQEYTFLYSHPVGTLGYVDPLYAETGLLTKESDVYSFGVVLFEVLCGKLCIGYKNPRHLSFAEFARQSFEQNIINEIVFVNMKDEIDPKSLQAFAKIAYQCLKRDPDQRPLMSHIVGALETALGYQELKSYQVSNAYLPPEPSMVLESDRGKYHPDKNASNPEASELFKEAIDAEGVDMEIDLSNLGTVNKIITALFSKLVVPIKTTISANVLEEASNGTVTVRPLRIGSSVSGKVEKQSAHFYCVTISDEQAQSGIVVRVTSAAQSKFKLLYFEQDNSGGFSLALQEDSEKTGKVTSAGMYFLHALAMAKDPEAAFFKRLEGLQPCKVSKLRPGTHIFAVYGDNFFKNASYTIEAICATT